MRAIAVDWSGAMRGRAPPHLAGRGGARWAAARAPGGRSEPRDLVAHLIEELPPGTQAVVGLDFAFGVPAWFAAELGARTGDELWARVAERAEAWLAACEPPFWGRPGRGARSCRRTAADRGRAAGAKSVFQVGGAGAVGTASLRGMPLLRTLRAAGFSIWPFHDEAGRARSRSTRATSRGRCASRPPARGPPTWRPSTPASRPRTCAWPPAPSTPSTPRWPLSAWPPRWPRARASRRRWTRSSAWRARSGPGRLRSARPTLPTIRRCAPISSWPRRARRGARLRLRRAAAAGPSRSGFAAPVHVPRRRATRGCSSSSSPAACACCATVGCGEPFLDIRARVDARAASMGLLSIAFHPEFAENGRFYVNYTANGANGLETRVVEYRARGDRDPARQRARAAAHRPAVREPQRRPAGLRARTASSTSAWATAAPAATRRTGPEPGLRCSARSCASTWTARAGGRPTRIPRDNPYRRGGGAAGDLGLRAAQPLALQRSTAPPATCGSATSARAPIEEIDRVARGRGGLLNFGWDAFEGRAASRAEADAGPPRLARAPVRPRPGLLRSPAASSTAARLAPSLRGRYVYADYCQSWMRSMRPTAAVPTGHDVHGRRGITSFGENGAASSTPPRARRAGSTASRADDAVRRRRSRRPGRRETAAPSRRSRAGGSGAGTAARRSPAGRPQAPARRPPSRRSRSPSR